MTTLKEYWGMLASNDWYYMYSDDHALVRREAAKQKILKDIANESPEHFNLWNGWHLHMFTGKPWSNETQPMPVEPE